jgi:predicted DNA-binding transcriptional regulator YafY
MKRVIIDYTNWRGLRGNRRIRPTGLAFASNEYHREPCWMVLARDLDLDEDRTFPLQNIHGWQELGETRQAELDKPADKMKVVGEPEGGPTSAKG